MSTPPTAPTAHDEHTAGDADNGALSRVEAEALRVADDPILAQMLHEERVESEEVDAALLWRLLAYLRHHRALAALAVAMATIEAILMIMPAYLIGLAIDEVTSGAGRTPNAADRLARTLGEATIPAFADPSPAAWIVFFGLLVTAIWLVRWAIAVGTTWIVHMLGQRVVHDLRVDVFRHVTAMDQGYFIRHPVGRLVNRTTFDIQSISELFSDAFAQGLRDVLFIAVLVVVMLAMDVPLATMLILAFPILAGIGFAYRLLARPAMRTMSAVQSRMNAWLAENLAGMRENHLYGRRLRRETEYTALTDAHQASVTRVIQSWAVLRPAMMMTSAVGTALVLGVGYGRVTAGLVSIGVLLTFLQYTTRLWVPVRNLTEKFQLIQTALTAGERVMDVLDTRSRMTDAPDADRSLQVRDGHVAFRDVVFRYPGTTEDVLRGLSLDVPAGSSLALVGNTGAGKSTIIQLLCRFWDVSGGVIEVDGHDIRSMTLETLRGGIALVPQDVVVFACSLRENITLGRDVPDERILECLRAVRAEYLVERHEDGLDHEMEEGGRTLSIGERQLLNFARALVDDPPILILDEATANVDTETELRIQEALRTLTEGRTSIIIAHRLSTIRDCDHIVVLRKGRVLEAGDHDALLAQNGEYARLYRLHMQGETQ
ncbi:MAG: ABC transporter ATP-binding protein [Deltaproteobacteria bacterium]|nr:MAG: ABC transporter ATP-binding protein [Deltaproteobacteria bacterium]